MTKITKNKKLAIELVALCAFALMSWKMLKGGFLPFGEEFLAIVSKSPKIRGLFLVLIATTVFYVLVDFLSESLFLSPQTRRALLYVGLGLCVLGGIVMYTLKKSEKIYLSKKVQESRKTKKYKPKPISLHALVGTGRKETLKYKVGNSSYKELNRADSLGRTPLGLALLKNDLDAVRILVKSGQVEVSKESKNHPDIAKSPIRWAAAQVFGSSYVSPVRLIQSREAGNILAEAKLSEEEQAGLSDRINEITLKRLDEGFFAKNKNNIFLVSGGLGCLVAVGIIYKKFATLFRWQVLASIASLYGVSVMSYYLTGYLFYRKVAKLESAKGLDWSAKKKEEYRMAFFLRRIGMTWRLYFPIIPKAVELETTKIQVKKSPKPHPTKK